MQMLIGGSGQRIRFGRGSAGLASPAFFPGRLGIPARKGARLCLLQQK
jgi:hypothetical protein